MICGLHCRRMLSALLTSCIWHARVSQISTINQYPNCLTSYSLNLYVRTNNKLVLLITKPFSYYHFFIYRRIFFLRGCTKTFLFLLGGILLCKENAIVTMILAFLLSPKTGLKKVTKVKLNYYMSCQLSP